MEFHYVVPNTVHQFTKFQSQISRHAYPFCVTVLSCCLILGGTALLTIGLFWIFSAALHTFVNVENFLLALIPAALLAYNFVIRVVAKRVNSIFLKFSRFDVDFEFTTETEINNAGIYFNEGDRQTSIAWSAIGGVFRTKGFIAFYCRGLFYNVPLETIGTLEEQDRVFEVCKTWQAEAQGHATAKAFL